MQNTWAKDDINELLNKGVVKETAAFAPKGELTREDFARWVAKAYGLEAGNKALPFKDVSNHPYYNELAAACSRHHQRKVLFGCLRSQWEDNATGDGHTDNQCSGQV